MKDFAWSSGAQLMNYTRAKGDKLQGALFLPANYEPGKEYPTIVYIYERLSQGLNQFTPPDANGFNQAVYTSNGYAVLSRTSRTRSTTRACRRCGACCRRCRRRSRRAWWIRRRVGLHGHSWGGYQTAFLVTQTDTFKAAVAGAPLTNMISMYSSIYRNTGSANQADLREQPGPLHRRLLGQPEAYIRNSPVFHAKNVKTPLLILHNDKDGAVDFTQGIEYFNTLRRLQKPVVMLQYKGENHGLARRPTSTTTPCGCGSSSTTT